MSFHEYVISRDISKNDPPFYALIMAAIRNADDVNLRALNACWPDVVEEFKQRYNAPGGMLPED